MSGVNEGVRAVDVVEDPNNAEALGRGPTEVFAELVEAYRRKGRDN